jgi:hypothetical protein
MLIVRTNVHNVIGNLGGRENRAATLEAPHHIAGIGVQTIQSPVYRSDINRVMGNGWRGGHLAANVEFPYFTPAERIDSVHRLVSRAKKDPAFMESGRRHHRPARSLPPD